MIRLPVEPPVTEYLHRKAAKLKIPLNGTFEVTPCCNMNCKMCYVRMEREQQEKIAPLRTVKEWLELAEKMKEQGLVYLLLTGGEPFLRYDFKEIFQGLHRMGFVISINSNGTLINDETIKWLKETPPSRINITLYGASDETYQELCGNPRGFTQVKNAIRLLKEAGINVKLNCSVTPYNAHDLDKIFAFAKKEKLIMQATAYMFPSVRKDEKWIGYNDRFTADEAAFYSAKIEMLMNGEEYFYQHVANQTMDQLSIDTDDCQQVDGDGVRCRAGKCSFWVTWDGKLLPCGMFPVNDAQNVFDTDFQKAWQKVVSDVENIRLPGKCKNCTAKDKCRACAAMVYTETGSFSKIPEYRCQMTEKYYKICSELLKQSQYGGKQIEE